MVNVNKSTRLSNPLVRLGRSTSNLGGRDCEEVLQRVIPNPSTPFQQTKLLVFVIVAGLLLISICYNRHALSDSHEHLRRRTSTTMGNSRSQGYEPRKVVIRAKTNSIETKPAHDSKKYATADDPSLLPNASEGMINRSTDGEVRDDTADVGARAKEGFELDQSNTIQYSYDQKDSATIKGNKSLGNAQTYKTPAGNYEAFVAGEESDSHLQESDSFDVAASALVQEEIDEGEEDPSHDYRTSNKVESDEKSNDRTTLRERMLRRSLDAKQTIMDKLKNEFYNISWQNPRYRSIDLQEQIEGKHLSCDKEDAFAGIPIDRGAKNGQGFWMPPGGYPIESITKWVHAYESSMRKIKQVEVGGDELRNFAKMEVKRLRKLRHDLFCRM